MLASLSLLLVLAPQGEVHGRGDRLVIPDRVTEPQRPAAQDPRGPVAAPGTDEQLHKDLLGLRRSLHLPDSRELALLQKLGQDYDRLPARLLRVLRSADSHRPEPLFRELIAAARDFAGSRAAEGSPDRVET